MASNGKAEYVTLEVLKEMMEIQDRACRSTLQILVNDMKSEIKSVFLDRLVLFGRRRTQTEYTIYFFKIRGPEDQY